MGDDFFNDFDETRTAAPVAGTPSNTGLSQTSSSGYGHSDSRSYAEDIFSEKILARSRTFYIDVKQSLNGKFVKISEKSRNGKKSTVMMDSEDLAPFIEALQKAQAHV